MNIFVLDDVRMIRQALIEAGIVDWKSKTLPAAHYALARSISVGLDVIQSSPVFDVWILDNDLGIVDGKLEEGYEFLKFCINHFGDKVPETVWSCSANPVRRQAIHALHANWLKAGRVPVNPI